MIQCKEIDYKKFGRCIFATDGVAEVIATLDIGPRIISYAPAGGENIFNENEDFDLEEKDEKYESFGDKGIWHNFGGHRLWTSPEVMPRTYFPDNEPCRYEAFGDRIRLYQVAQPYTCIELSMEIEFIGGGRIAVCHRVKNIGAWDIKLAPWAITVMSEGGLEVVPMRKDGPVYLPNRVISLWTYSKMSDERFKFTDKYFMLEQTSEPSAFKIGMSNNDGYAMYFNRGSAFIKYFDYFEDAEYPDNGCNFETYTDGTILEIESLAPLRTIKAGEGITHIERWKIIGNVTRPEKTEEAIDAFVKEYV